MARVTSKLQLTVPKVIASRYGIRPGDDLEWIPAGEVIRVLPPGRRQSPLDAKARLKLFDEMMERQRRRVERRPRLVASGRGWSREDLYKRGRAR